MVKVFAPATVANVAVGFDILGFALKGVGDLVTVKLINEPRVEILQIKGSPSIPTDPSKNTASVPLLAMIRELGLKKGFSISVEKGIPLGSGMGGSAASAVGAVVGAQKLLKKKLSTKDLLHFALQGEAIASGSAHADNVAPCLLGGMTAVLSNHPIDVVSLPVPALHCVIVHPHVVIETKTAREVLKKELLLSEHVRQSASLTGVIAALFRKDKDLLRRSMVDWVVGPQRAKLIPGFDAAKEAALRAGARCFAISGSGPSVFAWADSSAAASKIGKAAVAAFGTAGGVKADVWISAINKTGATVKGRR